MSNSERESLAKEHGMTVEFVDWFFDTKKEGCGNVWFMMMAAMWEGWKEQEAKCAALAAENAGLNEKMNKLATWPDVEFYASAWEFNNCDGHAALELLCDTDTPATDAFLAEVRAQGVDVAIEHLINKFEGTGRIGVPVMALEWLAQELRKGGAA